jgi:hypothetical protein
MVIEGVEQFYPELCLHAITHPQGFAIDFSLGRCEAARRAALSFLFNGRHRFIDGFAEIATLGQIEQGRESRIVRQVDHTLRLIGCLADGASAADAFIDRVLCVHKSLFRKTEKIKPSTGAAYSEGTGGGRRDYWQLAKLTESLHQAKI